MRSAVCPLHPLEVELAPTGAQNLGLSAHGVHQHLGGRDGHEMRTLLLHGAPEGAQFRFGQVPVMFGGRNLNDTSQGQGGVDLDQKLLDGVVVDLLDVLPDALSRLRRAPQFFDDRQDVSGPHAAQRPLPDRWPNEALEPGFDLVPIGLGLGHQSLTDPAPGERFELVGGNWAFLRQVGDALPTPDGEPRPGRPHAPAGERSSKCRARASATPISGTGQS